MNHNCPIGKATQFLGSKWTLELIYYLQERRRFCELQERVGGVNPSTLSQRLKVLEREGVVQRLVVPDSQRHVEYFLTDKGQDLLSVFTSLVNWVSNWYPEEAL
ncbi:MAG: transcriptional regulator [Chloroflexi bacterium HGW-Chloroflexi-8]|jgi:DNA-binding HxlR family transcriptional regulator|nr:helix-turn-helix transcriptional regulator [Chloroflexota bacterium]PKN86438.1 MAG: transcriptional regulator [Chloroflexi bacterium HGW-Chloroflexi-8]